MRQRGKRSQTDSFVKLYWVVDLHLLTCETPYLTATGHTVYRLPSND